jgi:membrane protein implicated in regulation of membrane protease activity
LVVMPIYVLWFIAALGLLVIELHSATFFAVFLAAGAFAAGVVAFLMPDSAVWIQAVLALGVAMLGVVLVRPFVSKRLRRHGDATFTPGVHGGFVGQRALALDEVGDELHPGHVRLAGETWLAFSDAPPIATGAPVIVTAVRGTTLAVRPASGSVAPET